MMIFNQRNIYKVYIYSVYIEVYTIPQYISEVKVQTLAKELHLFSTSAT